MKRRGFGLDKLDWLTATLWAVAVSFYLVHVVASIVEGRWWLLILMGFPPLGMVHGAMHIGSWF